MNYIKINKCDIANGNGVRCVLWVSGCDVHCKGCHNPESWDFDAGQVFDGAAMDELLKALDHPWIKGLTLSGGHPLAHPNLNVVYTILKTVRRKFPDKDIWLYTGYTLNVSDFVIADDYNNSTQDLRKRIISMCDVVVDGNYDETLRDISLRFRGSSNQRLIDVKRTVKEKKIIPWEV